ncbi:MAG: hypothetical protein JNK04_14700 [Myxococcales bacterium]|nr:hypothetical protein [Myxococcales bacterium]
MRPSPSTPRFSGALIGLAVVVIFTVAFFALRKKSVPPAPAPLASAVESARPSRSELASHAETEVPTARPVRKKGALRPSAAPPEPEAPSPSPEQVSDPKLKAVLAARADTSPKGTKTLIDNLTSSDEIVVAEATKALIARKATEAIEPLAKISLEKAAGSGLSVIDALGKLGGAAEGDQKKDAVERLLQMLREEKRRRARESPGNLLQIYEALGDTHDPKAAPALEAELLDATVPRAPKVVIVQAIVDIGLPSSKTALETAHAEQAAQAGADAFEEEIRQELVATIEQALEAL